MQRILILIATMFLIVGLFIANAETNVTNAPPPPPLDYLAPGASACFVYPITFHKNELTNVVSMPDPNAPVNQIPISSTFIVEHIYSYPYPSSFYLLKWTSGSYTETIRATTLGGTLGEGLIEGESITGYPNGPNPYVLEKGDWIRSNLRARLGTIGSASVMLVKCG